MVAAGESVGGDSPDSRFQHEMVSLCLQQVESLQKIMSLGLQQVESIGRVEALLKVLVESQVNTQLRLSQNGNSTSSISSGYKNEDEKDKAVPNPPSSSSSTNPLHQP
ncbi:hypothetical protein MKW94_004787, partial [Papaver nudicaule]|nr:hypothetical protein [Papaver nudicaule]MCL7044508.1 hypothetical protein [Papaver nudicaule]